MKVQWKPQPYAKELKARARNERIKEALCLLFMFGVFTFILLFFSQVIMIEFFKHILGLCGEPHGLIHIILTFGGISAIIKYIKLKTFKK